MKKIFVVLAAMFLLSVMACSGGGGDGNSSNTSGQSAPVLAPNATQVDSATGGNLSSVSDDGATLTFSASTPQLDALKKDDVIVSGVTTATPRGLLKKVVSVSKLPDGTVQVMTTPAALTDAFEELHISGTIKGVSNESLVKKGVDFVRKALGQETSANIPDISFKIPLTNMSVSGGNSYTAKMSGKFKFTPDFIYEIDISKKLRLNKVKLALKGDQTYNLDGTYSTESALSVSPELSLTGATPVLIGTPIVAGPVVFTLEYALYGGVEFSAEGKIDINTGYELSSSQTLGFEYKDGSYSPVASFDGSFSPYYTISNQITSSIKPYLRPKFGIYVYDVAGPYFDIKPYGKIAAVAMPNPHLEKSYGIQGDAGGELKILTWTLADLHVELFDINIPYNESKHTISGRITNSSGTPLSNVSVTLTGSSTASAKTNADGYYKFTDISDGSYAVTPTLAGYSFNPISVPVVVASGDVIVPRIIDTTAVTTTYYSMSGTIHVGSTSGAVLSGAIVSIAGLTATTSGTGTFSITGIPAGTYAFSASKSGYNTYTNSSYYVGSDQTGLNFYLTPTVAPSTAKAITAFSFASPSAVGVITESTHSIAVTMPSGTNVTALIATFTTTGASVKVGSTIQESGTTANNFTNPVIYTVTAADATTQNYTVTLTAATPSGDYTSPNIGTLKYVPAGSFQRDGTASNISTVSAFRMSQYEITRAQFLAIMGTDPSYTPYSSGTNDPVQMVTWYDAVAFAGSTGSNAIGDYAVFGYYTSETGRTTTERTNTVGSKLANELGLHDMSGNVWEWNWDWSDAYPTGTQTNYRGAASGTYRVVRGGSWHDDASYATVAHRGYNLPNDQYFNLGFRVVRP